MPESLNLKSLAPSPPPYPPLPRFIFEGGSSPPELPKIPKEAEEAEDVVGSVFEGVRGVHSAMQTRRRIDKLLREPTRLFPVGKRE